VIDGKAPRFVTNVRDAKVLTSRFWLDSFEQRRCLVPASSFCEPFGDVKSATWHWFALKGDEPRPLFAFPGIWALMRPPPNERLFFGSVPVLFGTSSVTATQTGQ